MGEFFEAQEDTWFDGGAEWYARENNISLSKVYAGGIPGDYDPFVFLAETTDERKVKNGKKFRTNKTSATR